MADLITAINTPLIIDVNSVVNNNSNGYWKIVGTSLVHDNSRESYVEKSYPFLTEGKTYEVRFSASHTSCQYRSYLGDTAGILRNASGDHLDTFVFTGTNKKLRFWSNGTVSIFRVIINELQSVVSDSVLPLDDITKVENKSYTLSYSPIAKQYLSYHSYLPNNYIIHPNSLLTKRNDSQLMQVNKGDYGKYFDEDIKSFIIETIFNEYPIETKVFDNLTINLKSTLNDVPTNKFFDNLILNTEYQCSGNITLNLSNLTKKERNWCINKFEDITNNQPVDLFSKDWNDTQEVYPIDKVVNGNKINYTKPWFQRARFRDKFLQVRFIENNLDNNKIVCNFVSSIYRASQR